MSNFIDITDYDASIHREILDSLLRQGTADYDPQIVEICEDRAVMEMRSYLTRSTTAAAFSMHAVPAGTRWY